MRGLDLGLTHVETLERVKLGTAIGGPVIQYSHLPGQSGGFDPRNPDCGSHWELKGRTVVTSDCVGWYCWVRGVDRFQPVRFAHLYGGWQNTDSIIQDATGPQRCWRRLERPVKGCAVVYPSTFLGKVRLRMGHIACVTDVPAEFAPETTEWWKAVRVVDCHGPRLKGPAIGHRDASIWQKRGIFVEWRR